MNLQTRRKRISSIRGKMVCFHFVLLIDRLHCFVFRFILRTHFTARLQRDAIRWQFTSGVNVQIAAGVRYNVM